MKIFDSALYRLQKEMIIVMKKILAICICAVVLSGCVSCKSISSAASLSNSSNPSKSPVTTNSSSNSTSALPTSKTKSLMSAEDDHTKAIFHIGMTREQVKQALKDNQLRIKPDDYGASDKELSSPHETQNGLKIGDTVETVIKLYG